MSKRKKRPMSRRYAYAWHYISFGSTALLIIYMQACKGLRNIYASAKITLVPIKEMADVLYVESKNVDLARDTWVRMKLGVYKGDLAKVRSHHFS